MRRTKNIACIGILFMLALFMMVGCVRITVLYEPPSDALVDFERSETPVEAEAQVSEAEYVLNTSSKIYHVPDCHHIRRMVQKNYRAYVGTAEALRDMGYTACGTCH